MNSKQIIDIYFNNNYNKLLEIANNILKKYNQTHLKYDLLSLCYIFLIENLIIENIEAFAVNYMHKQLNWTKTIFKKQYINKTEDLTEDLTEKFIDDFEINIEEEFIHQQKNNILQIIIAKLSQEDKILYDLRFIKKLNYRKISEITKIPFTTIYLVTKELERKIQKQYIHYVNNNI